MTVLLRRADTSSVEKKYFTKMAQTSSLVQNIADVLAQPLGMRAKHFPRVIRGNTIILPPMRESVTDLTGYQGGPVLGSMGQGHRPSLRTPMKPDMMHIWNGSPGQQTDAEGSNTGRP